ncbi:protein-export chaperone SecB [uncultured Desulfuromonas sp.]|uniref:protein-export chaperone SecB n=1 Tax=uncultured Desulfuromonas sp. TaxID=181013 RepID=UPI002AAA680E|nr:protein-export chaperone SecB [uncultured Desulfuromonas sp.]
MDPIADFTFLDFRIRRLNFSLNEKFNGKQSSTKVQTEFKIRHERNKNRMRVYMTITFSEEKAPFHIEIEGMALFDLNRTFEETELELLTNNYCSAAMFPYLREAIADITRRAGFPPLHIPQVDFSRVFSKKSAESAIHTLH